MLQKIEEKFEEFIGRGITRVEDLKHLNKKREIKEVINKKEKRNEKKR